MRKKNLLTSDFVDTHRLQAKEPLQQYCCVDGGLTTDLAKAVLNEFGEPVTMGFSSKDFSVTKKVKPLSFSPLNPLNRLRAFEARAKMNELTSVPTDYHDKFEAITYVNNVSSAFTKAFQERQKVITNE